MRAWRALALTCVLAAGCAEAQNDRAKAAPASAATETAIFATGCFWCTESDFEKLDGVVSAVSGYTGGKKENPSYEDHEGHIEGVEIVFDPAKVSYARLVDHFWHTHDPFNEFGQFCDDGHSYRGALFYLNEEQKKIALASLAEMDQRFEQPIRTLIRPASKFWPAEDYHQNYAKLNPVRYRYYRSGCGRDARLKQIWGEKK